MKRIGYVAQNLSILISASRTFRLRNLSEERSIETICQNLAELERIFEWNFRKKIFLYRISSEIIPFASHPANTLDWRETFKDRISKIGETVKAYKQRVSMHPGQYTVLNSPTPPVVKNAVNEIVYHSDFLDLMKLDSSHKVIIHVGGKYGDKGAAMERFEDNFAKMLPESSKKRLVIENDDKNYTVNDCIDLSAKINTPVVYDHLHHLINHDRGADVSILRLLKKVFKTWKHRDGLPKIHYSNQEPGASKGSHSKSIDVDELIQFFKETEDLDFDIMLETKDKNLSVLNIMNSLGRRGLKS